MVDGIRHTANFDPLVPGRYSQWMAAIEEAGPTQKQNMLNLSGVKMVEFTDSTTPLGVSFQPVSGNSERFRWVDCALMVPDAEAALAVVTTPDFDFDSEVVLEGSDPTARTCTGGTLKTLEIHEETPNRVTIKVSTDGPGWLFQADTWFPGWRAQVDGDRVPLYNANFLFRAVPVPAGSHQVVLVYQPFSFYLGVLISLGTWAWLGVRFVRKQR
jgi:hypothetical protein